MTLGSPQHDQTHPPLQLPGDRPGRRKAGRPCPLEGDSATLAWSWGWAGTMSSKCPAVGQAQAPAHIPPGPRRRGAVSWAGGASSARR